MKNILVATDGSETSKQALIEAKAMAECHGSKVKIIHVRPSTMMPTYLSSVRQIEDHQDIIEEEKKYSELLLEESLKVFEDFPGEVSTVSRDGDAGEEIIKEAEEGNHDLVIMGSRGLGTFSKTLLGSVTNKVLNHSNKRVLVIR